MIGIYCLKFPSSSLLYIGQSKDIDSRYLAHKRNLVRLTHHNYKMQEYFNTTGELPDLYIMEEVSDLTELDNKEIEFISGLDTFYNGFNLTKGGFTNPIVNTGEHCNSKHPKQLYIDILFALAYTELLHKDIAKLYEVNKRVVDSICVFSNHKYLLTEFPEVCQHMINNRRLAIRKIKSPEGIIYEIAKGRGNEFAEIHGLDGNSLNSVLRGRLKSTAGWVLP